MERLRCYCRPDITGAWREVTGDLHPPDPLKWIDGPLCVLYSQPECLGQESEGAVACSSARDYIKHSE